MRTTDSIQIVDEFDVAINPATEEKQDAQNALLNDIKTNTASINLNVDTLELNTDGLESGQASILAELQLKADLTETQPVSVASLPLPTGASTEATLALIKAKTDNLDVALSTRAVTGLTDAQLRATPVPVSGTFFQATQPISASSLPLPTGASTEATLATRLTESDFDTKTGSLTEVAPATDTASSGINGRLQRIAQRITSLITALGTPFQAGGSIGNTAFGSTQSGTWTVQPGNTANTTAWKVDGSAVTQPVSGIVTANATLAAETTKVIGTTNLATGGGRTLLFGAIAQGAAGTTSLVGAQVGLKIKVVSYTFTLSATGTAQFTGPTVTTGAMDIATNGGVVMVGQVSSHLLETAVNTALSIVTTGGAAKGHFSYFLEA